MDEQLVSWLEDRPDDWQITGRCNSYLFGASRHGQLADATPETLVPKLAASFQQAQYVSHV